MFSVNRTGALAVVLTCSLVFLPPFNGMLKQGLRILQDALDTRPEQTVLFIGNSRTFYHDMPFMVRLIADSAGYPGKLHVVMDAQSNASLADHLNEKSTQELIARRWDHVVLQVLSSEQYSAEQASGAWDTAATMINEVKANGSTPAMFVTWRYTDQCTPNKGMPPNAIGLSPAGYPGMHANIQNQHALLAERTGVDLVNVGLVWEDLQGRPKDFKLYDDCNHPSIYGSYLTALMFYGYFAGRDVSDVTYRPDEVSPEDAHMLRTVVSEFSRKNTGVKSDRVDGVSMR